MYKIYADGSLKVCCKREYLIDTYIDLCKIYGEEKVEVVKVRDKYEKEDIFEICS